MTDKSMTQAYTQAIQDASNFFSERIRGLPPLTLSEDGYAMGTDSLGGEYKNAVSECYTYMVYHHHYELSYNQICQAFFRAVTGAGKLTVEGAAP